MAAQVTTKSYRNRTTSTRSKITRQSCKHGIAARAKPRTLSEQRHNFQRSARQPSKAANSNKKQEEQNQMLTGAETRAAAVQKAVEA